MSKTLAEINDALQQEYDGLTEEKDGYTYIPWAAAVDKANHIFGYDGWDVEVREEHLETIIDPIEGHPTYQYIATVRVHVHPSDGESFFRDGVGTNEVTFTRARDNTDELGKSYHVPPKAQIDTAAKGAASDATTRGLRLFGRALGLGINLDAISAKANGTLFPKRTFTPTTNEEKPASEAQKGLLLKLKVPADKMDGLTMRQASSLIKALKDDKKPLAQALASIGAKAPVAATPQKSSDDFEDLDEFLSNN